MRTFDLLEEIIALDEMLIEVNEETGEIVDNTEVLKEYIERLEITKNEKLNNIERLKREKKSQIEAIEAEVKRLQNRAITIDNEVSRLNWLELQLLQGEKRDTGLFKFSFRKSESVVIEDEESIPDDFKNVTKQIKIDKKALKKAIKNGEEVKGAKIVEKRGLLVR